MENRIKDAEITVRNDCFKKNHECIVCCWPMVRIPCPNHETVGFQPQAVDIPDIVFCASPQIHFQSLLHG